MNKKYDTQININKNKSNDLLNIIKKNENEIKLLKINNNKLLEQKNKTNLDFTNFKEMIINVIKSKTMLIKNQLNNIKDSYLKEIQKTKNENKSLTEDFIINITDKYFSNQKNCSNMEKTNIELSLKNKQLVNNINNLKNKIDNLQKKLNDEISIKNNLMNENDIKNKDITNFQENLTKLKTIYENKISILNTQIKEKEKNLNDKNSQIKQLNELINQEKNKNKNLDNKLDILNQQNLNYKKNTEKIIQNKESKIKQLQQIVNQSFSSLNHGMDNVQLAKKLDNEVQQLIQNVKNHNNDLNDV